MPALRARDICEQALRHLGVTSAEEPIPAYTAEAALVVLNMLLSSWATESLLVWQRPPVLLALVAGQGVYTWGTDGTAPGDIPTTAPVRLDSAVLIVDDSPPLEWPVAVLTQEEYELGLWSKALTSTYPSCVYLEAALPLARLYVWPVPARAYTLKLLPWDALPQYGHWDDVLWWPEGYLRALAANVATELSPSYGVQPSPLLLQMASESKATLYPQVAAGRVGRLSMQPGERWGTWGNDWARFVRGGP